MNDEGSPNMAWAGESSFVRLPLLFIPLDSFVCYLVAQLCLTLWDPMDCSPPDSSIHGILQARILEWVATPSSRGSSWPRDRTHISYVSYTYRWVLYHYCHLGRRRASFSVGTSICLPRDFPRKGQPLEPDLPETPCSPPVKSHDGFLTLCWGCKK